MTEEKNTLDIRRINKEPVSIIVTYKGREQISSLDFKSALNVINNF